MNKSLRYGLISSGIFLLLCLLQYLFVVLSGYFTFAVYPADLINYMLLPFIILPTLISVLLFSGKFASLYIISALVFFIVGLIVAKKGGFAVLALIMGFLSILPSTGIFFAVYAIIFGILAIRSKDKISMAITGMVLAVIFVISMNLLFGYVINKVESVSGENNTQASK